MPYRQHLRDQDWLLPPSLGELIPEDHPVRFIAEFVALLEWAEIGIKAEAAVAGAPSYPPAVLLSIWLYGFMVRVRSSRRLERSCREHLPMMWLAGTWRPDHSTLPVGRAQPTVDGLSRCNCPVNRGISGHF